jgi:hypothetical protein
MWTRDPTGQSQGEGERRRRPQLAGGEVSDQAKRTGVISTHARTQRCSWRDLTTSRSQPPPCMAERRCGSPTVRHSQPRQVAWRRSRASGTWWGTCARERRVGSEAEVRCPRSGSSPASKPELLREITEDRDYTMAS